MEFDGTEYNPKNFGMKSGVFSEGIGHGRHAVGFSQPSLDKQLSLDQRPICSTYSSIIGEFHKLGNLEDETFFPREELPRRDFHYKTTCSSNGLDFYI